MPITYTVSDESKYSVSAVVVCVANVDDTDAFTDTIAISDTPHDARPAGPLLRP